MSMFICFHIILLNWYPNKTVPVFSLMSKTEKKTVSYILIKKGVKMLYSDTALLDILKNEHIFQ